MDIFRLKPHIKMCGIFPTIHCGVTALVVIVLLLILYSFFRTQSVTEKQAFLMDTPIKVKVEGDRGLVDQAIGKIKRLDNLFSIYNPNSEISRLNRGEKIEVSPDTKKILELSEQMKKLTNGAFDVQYSGKIDLGAIAKGYAVETARELLVKSGAKNGMIDMCSSIAVFGLPAGRQGPRPWKVGIQHPREKNKLLGIVELNDGQSLGTSGDYERGLHIIDPKTGEPAETAWTVTIIGTNAAVVDALSTGVYVLGAKKGMSLIESLADVEGLIMVGKNKILKSSGFNLK